MTKNPIKVNQDVLAETALSIMSNNKVTSLCVYKNNNKSKIHQTYIKQISPPPRLPLSFTEHGWERTTASSSLA